MEKSRQFKTFYRGLALVIVLNIYDMASTLYWCTVAGEATEANPLLYQLMLINPALAVGFKTLMVLLFTDLMLVAAQIDIKLAIRGTYLVALIYLLLAGWHMILPLLPAILAWTVTP